MGVDVGAAGVGVGVGWTFAGFTGTGAGAVDEDAPVEVPDFVGAGALISASCFSRLEINFNMV